MMISLDILLLGFAVFFTGKLSAMDQGCCESKTVGPNTYTLVEDETASEAWGCNSLCVYKMEGKPDSRFCFRSGDLPVNCIGDSRKIIIKNNLTIEVNGTVFFEVCFSINFNVCSIEPKPFTIPPSGQVPVTVPVGITGIINITAAEESPLGRVCDPLLSPYGSIFGVTNIPPPIIPLACEVVNLEPEDYASEFGTCRALPNGVGLPVQCLLIDNNCNPGFEPIFGPPPACLCRCGDLM